MKIEIESPINKYYVQTLCMIFFPGEKFSGEDEDADTPYLYLKTYPDETGIVSHACLKYKGKDSSPFLTTTE